MRLSRAATAGTVAALVALASCGGGTVTSEDVTPGEAGIIGVIIVAAVLYAIFIGLRGGR